MSNKTCVKIVLFVSAFIDKASIAFCINKELNKNVINLVHSQREFNDPGDHSARLCTSK